MDSTKYGGIEKFNAALSAASSDKFVFVYNSLPRSETYIHDIESRGNKIVAIPTADKIGYIKRCLQLIKQEKPDVVHFHFDSTKYLLAPIIKLLYPKIKQIATYHSEFSTNSKTTLALAKIFNKCQSSVIAVSKGVKRGIESRLYNCQDSPRIIVSYLGVSTQEWGGGGQNYAMNWASLQTPLFLHLLDSTLISRGLTPLRKASSTLRKNPKISISK